MADTSPLTILTNRIITLLVGNGSTYFALKVLEGNRFTKLSGTAWSVTPPPNNRNLTRCILDCPTMSTPNRNTMKTFTNAVSAVGDVVIDQKFVFSLKFIYFGTDRSIGNQMEIFLSGVLLQDPKLGLTTPIIKESGQIDTRWQESSNDDTGGQKGLIQTINFPVTIQLRRADLDAASAGAWPTTTPTTQILAVHSNGDGTYDVQCDASVTVVGANQEPNILLLHNGHPDLWIGSSTTTLTTSPIFTIRAAGNISNCAKLSLLGQPTFVVATNPFLVPELISIS